MNTTSKSISQGFAGLTCKVPVLFLTALLAACGGGGGGSDNGGGSSSSSSSGGSSSSGSSSSSGGSTSSSSGGGETAPDQPTLTMQPQAIKTFQFNWEPVNGANEYRLLENPDGVSGYEQIAIVDGETREYGLVVFLPEKVNASYMLQACNSVGCTDSESVAVTGNLEEAIGYIKASDANTQNFGRDLALSSDGSTLAVGTPVTNDGGVVYIFIKDNGNWQQQARLNAANADPDDEFGSAVSLSADGNVLAVGASNEGSAATGVGGNQADNSAAGSGAAYVFTRNGGTWQQQTYLKASNTSEGDSFGYVSLSADGTTLAVGAAGEDSAASGIDGDQADNSAEDSGAVYMFAYADGNWQQQAYLKASNTQAGDGLYTVALSSDGSTLAVSARGEDSAATGINGDQTDNSATSSGAVYVFTRESGNWQQHAYIKASNTDTSDDFGTNIAVSSDGKTLAVGAQGEGSASAGIDSDQTDNSAPASGAVYVFSLTDSGWQQQAYIKSSNPDSLGLGQQRDSFGFGISLDENGTRLVVGASGEGSSATGLNGDESDNSAWWSGAAYLFTLNGGAWQQQTYIKASNVDVANDYDFDGFGFHLALSADGKTLAVSAPQEDGAATGIGGDQTDQSVETKSRGAVYLY